MAPGTARGRTTAMDNDGRRRTTNGDNGQRWIPWVYTNPDHVEVTMRSSSTPRTRNPNPQKHNEKYDQLRSCRLNITRK